MNKKMILFDLDGTLTDSKPGITRSVQYALEKMGFPVPDTEELTPFVGPPLTESFQKYCAIDEAEAEKAVGIYREYYTDKGIYENSLYEGVKPMLAELKAAGKTLIVATSKPEVFARQILKYFEVDHYFSVIAGAELNGQRTDKAQVIEYALAQAGPIETKQAVMVGDRKHDIIGAKKMDLQSIGVLYGYGSRAELTNAGADYIAEDMDHLRRLLTDAL